MSIDRTELKPPVQPRSASEGPSVLRRSAEHIAHAVGRVTSPARVEPDYLIVGAQRAGTTSLYKYLVRHPDVARVIPAKEVHFFDLNFWQGWGWYRAHFPIALTANHRGNGRRLLTGEASPYYMFHPLAPYRIAAALPAVKLIVLLRDPVTRAYSQYQHEVALGYESLSFEEAIEAEPGRLAGEAERLMGDPRYVSFHHQHHSYLARGRYAEQLRLLFHLFPAERVMVVRTEDLFAEPAAVTDRVVSFLGLSPAGLGPFERFNGHVYHRLPPSLRRRLADRFADENEQLFNLLNGEMGWGRWTRPEPIPTRAS